MSFLLTTDTSCDFIKSELNKIHVPYIPFTFTVNGSVFNDDFDALADYNGFYKRIKDGAMPATSQINPILHEQFFTSLIEAGHKEILHLSLSGGLSATATSAAIGAKAVMDAHKGVKIEVIDTISATIAHGAVLSKAMQLRDAGESLSGAAEYINEFKHSVQAWLVVDDLMHLKRGGRIGGAAAYIGTLLKIKPVIVVNKEGGLSVYHKAKGTKAAIKYIVERYNELSNGDGNVIIGSGDADEMAEETAGALLKNANVKKIERGYIGPIIGTHTGPGSMGIVFIGKPRVI